MFVRVSIQTDHPFTLIVNTIAIANVRPLSEEVMDSSRNASTPVLTGTLGDWNDTTYSFNRSMFKHFCPENTVFGRNRVREKPFVQRRSSRWSARLHRSAFHPFLLSEDTESRLQPLPRKFLELSLASFLMPGA
jgi:hypothetical protein